jgi:hypothetical protein
VMMMEGKFSGEGLDGFEEDDDMVTSMVRELLEEGKVGESADAVWANLAHERAQMFAQTPLHVAAEQEEPATDGEVSLDAPSAFEFDANEEEAELPVVQPKPFLVEAPVVVPVPILVIAPAPQSNVLMFETLRPQKASRHKPVEDEDQMRLFG